MKMDFQSWMRAVWLSIVEPTASANTLMGMTFPRNALWMAVPLIAALNVILLAVLQLLSPAPVAFEEQAFSLSPFAYAIILTVFVGALVFGIFQAGRVLGGSGTLEGSLAVVVWFQAISLTLEAIQLVLVLLSPSVAAIFGLLSLGAMIWCFINFVNVLHGFNNLGNALGTIVLALIGTALTAGILLTVLGVVPAGGLT